MIRTARRCIISAFGRNTERGDSVTEKLTKAEKKEFYRIIFPSMVEILFIQCFAFADKIMIGHVPGSTTAVAALSLCAAPINLTVCVMNAFFIGTTAAIARNHGAGNEDEMRNTAFQTMLLSLVAGAVITFFTFSFSGRIMHFVCGDTDSYEIAAMYYRINTIGFFAQIISMNVTAAFRGVGITKLPMVCNLIGNAANVVLNYILIYGKLGFPAMNAEGAAVATVVSKYLILLIALALWLIKKTPVRPSGSVTLKPCESISRLVFPIGITSAGEQLILQTGATITAKIVATLPTNDIASCSIVSSVESIAWATGDACCTASTTLFGRCLGEGREDKSKSYLRLISGWALGFAAFEILLIFTCGRGIATLFSNDASLYDEAVKLMMLGAVSLPFINMHKTVSGALRSAGDSVAPLMASLLSLWVFRVALGFLLIPVLNKGVFAYRWCLNLDQLVRMSAVLVFYFTGHWRKFVDRKKKI